MSRIQRTSVQGNHPSFRRARPNKLGISQREKTPTTGPKNHAGGNSERVWTQTEGGDDMQFEITRKPGERTMVRKGGKT